MLGTTKRLLKGALSAIVGTVFIQSAHAASYEYNGANFLYSIDRYDTSLNLSGSIELADPLAANLSGADILADLTDWTFTDGVDVYTPANATMDAFFNIDTNATGDIVDWDFSFSDANAPTTIEVYSADPNGDAVFFADLITGRQSLGITLTPGGWTTVSGLTPAPIPLPATLPLMAFAAAGLMVSARRKAR